MKTIKFRELRADEVELRVGATNESGFSLLIYKTARADANVLDETVGALNWQKKFYQVKNTMICSLGINMNYDDETKEPVWIWKDDGGDDDFQAEKVKGECSDAFKRAGFAFGIARSLYNSPFIWITKSEKNDSRKTRYYVKEIDYKDNAVSKLVICEEKSGEVVYSYPRGAKVSQTSQNTYQNGNGQQIKNYKSIILENISSYSSEQAKQFWEWVSKKYNGKFSISQLTEVECEEIANRWGFVK